MQHDDSPAKRYQIVDWQLHYENNKSRERDELSWVPIPNARDGLGFQRILRAGAPANPHKGVAMFGCFILLVEICSRQRRIRNGWLTHDGTPDGTPYTADDLSLKLGIQADLIQETLDLTSSKQVGWIRAVGTDGHLTGTPRALDGHQQPAESLGREGKGREVQRGGVGVELPDIRTKHPAYGKLKECHHFTAITPEMYLNCIRSHPGVDESKAVQAAILRAEMAVHGIDEPGFFLNKQFERLERSTMSQDQAKGSGTGKLTVWSLKQIIEAKERSLREITRDDSWRQNSKKVAEYKKLRASIEEAKQKLAAFPVHDEGGQ